MNLFTKSKKVESEYSPNEVFPAIDRERIARDLDLAATGTRNGRDDIPESDRTDLDATENDVVSKIEEIRRKGLSRFSDEVGVYRERIGRVDGIDDDIQAAANDAETNFKSEISSSRERLKVVRKRYNDVKDEFREFQKTNRIVRTPHNHKGLLQWFAIACVITLAESLINAYFFSKEQELGLIGGFFIAVFVSFLNVGFTSLSGHAFRDINHINVGRKILGWSALLFGIFFPFHSIFSSATSAMPLLKHPGCRRWASRMNACWLRTDSGWKAWRRGYWR